MKGKAIILTILTAVCMSCSAYAAELVIDNGTMDYDTDSYNMDVHHSGNEIRPITIQVKNTETNKSCYFSEALTDEAGNISLKIPMNSERNSSGEYVIMLSGADIAESEKITIVYVNKTDAANIISAIKNNSPGLADYIRANIYGVGLDANVKSMWDSIGSSGQDSVVQAIAGKSFSNIGEAAEAFSYAICTLQLNNADISSTEKIINECSGYLGLDTGEGSWYAQLESKQPVLSALSGKSFSLTTDSDDKTGVKAAFKTAAALAWINEAGTAERARITEVINDSNEYLGLPLDGDYAKLSASAQKSVMIGILNYRPIANKDALITAFNKSLAAASSGGSSGGGSGGSGGGGTGGVSTPVKKVPTVSIPAVPAATDQSSTTEQQITEGFTDIENHWAREYITELAEKNIVGGTEANRFSPDRNILREEVVKIIVRSMNLTASSSISVFEDVRNDEWYYPYIVTAEKSGIVQGISDNKFGIGLNISRQDLAVLVARMLSMNGIMLDSEAKEAFTDQALISDYAADAVNGLRNAGVISGDEYNAFNPQDSATRAEFAKIISEAMKLTDSKE